MQLKTTHAALTRNFNGVSAFIAVPESLSIDGNSTKEVGIFVLFSLAFKEEEKKKDLKLIYFKFFISFNESRLLSTSSLIGQASFSRTR